MTDPRPSDLRSALVAGAAVANRRRRRRTAVLATTGAIVLVAAIGWATNRPSDQVSVVDPASSGGPTVPASVAPPPSHDRDEAACAIGSGDGEPPVGAVRADVDADGGPELVWVEWDSEDPRLVVEASAGTRRSLDLPNPAFVDVLGAADLDDDGLDELFLMIGGNTVDPVEVMRFVDLCSVDTVPVDDAPEEVRLAIAARSMGVPGGMEAIRCEAGERGVDLVQISTRRDVPDRNGDGVARSDDLEPTDPYQWTRTVLSLEDGRLVVTGTSSGTSATADPAVPIANDFVCTP